jgi:cytochrome c
MRHLTTPMLAAMLLGAVATPVLANPEATFGKAGCVACHAKDKKLVGPSLKDIAARYKGQAQAVPTLVAKTRAGGKGVYGPIPMPPNSPEKIADADLNAVIEWILTH